MVTLYVFCLVLGGGFLGLSLLGDLLGGDVGDVAIDADVSLDFDAHMDVDAHLDVDSHIDIDTDAGHAAHAVAKIFSVRSVIYSMFGFGAVGTLLTWLWGGDSPFVIGSLAVVTGILSGTLINSTFAYLRRSDSGAHLTESSYAGCSGTVTLPIGVDVPGKIAVERAGRRIKLRALPHSSALDQDVEKWKSVFVVEMKDGIALVTPAEEELLLEP